MPKDIRAREVASKPVTPEDVQARPLEVISFARSFPAKALRPDVLQGHYTRPKPIGLSPALADRPICPRQRNRHRKAWLVRDSVYTQRVVSESM